MRMSVAAQATTASRMTASDLDDLIEEQTKILELNSLSDLVRQDCAILILEATTNFLVHDNNAERTSRNDGRKLQPQVDLLNQRPAQQPKNLRKGLLAIAKQLCTERPGNFKHNKTASEDYLFRQVLYILSKTSQTQNRSDLLDLLVYSLPKDKDVSEDMLQVFRTMLQKDTTSLIPILGVLTSLNLSGENRDEAWKLAHFSLSSASILPTRSDLPTVISPLLTLITNKEQAQSAIALLRSQLQTNCDEYMLVASLILDAIQHQPKSYVSGPKQSKMVSYGTLLRKEYINVLQTFKSPSFSIDDWKVLDVLAALALYQSTNAKIVTLFDHCLQRNTFCYSLLMSLLSSSSMRQSLLMDRLIPLLMELGIFLLLAPIRIGNSQRDTTSLQIYLQPTQEYLLALYHILDRLRQEELVRSILHLAEKIHKTNTGSKTYAMVTNACYQVCKSLASNNPVSILACKQDLLKRFTTSSAAYTTMSPEESTCFGALSELLVSFLLPAGAIDASEVVMLLQKLLFSSETDQVVKGIWLAQTAQPHLSRDNQECVHQWLVQILLPTNRRTVAASIGVRGVHFWIAQKNGADFFDHLKMILANTGMVQTKEAYMQKLQQKRSKGGATTTTLAYGDMTELSSSACPKSPNGKKKKREFIFCVDTYLTFRPASSHESWPTEVEWVFLLVDTYLQYGRSSSSSSKHKKKWAPHSWLGAAIELPYLPDILGELGSLCSSKTTIHLTRDEGQRKHQVQHLIRCSLAILLSTSLSLAVLKNAYEHYVDNKDREVLSLLKHQLFKVFDLESKTRRLAKTLYSKVKNVTIAQQMHRLTTDMLRDKLDTRVLETCCYTEIEDCDGSNDDLLLILRNGEAKHQSGSWLQLRILENLSSQDAVSPLFAQHVGKMMEWLFENSAKNPFVMSNVNNHLIELVSAYLKAMVRICSQVVTHVDAKQQECAVVLLNSCQPKKEADHCAIPVISMTMFEHYHQHLLNSHDATVAVLIVELLSLLAHLSKKEMLICKASQASWKMLHTVYPSLFAQRQIPCPSFDRIANSIMESSKNRVVSRIVKSTLVKCNTSSLKDLASHETVRKSLLLFWALLVESSQNDHTKDDAVLLSSLVDEIQTCLDGPTKENAPPMKTRRRVCMTRTVPIVTLPNVPTLNGVTLAAFMELLLAMVLASSSNATPAKTGTNSSPYNRLIVLIKLFTRLSNMLESNLEAFPARFVSVLVKSCYCMLELIPIKVQHCVEWRQMQPLLSFQDKQSGKWDPGSVSYLEALLKDLHSMALLQGCRTVSSESNTAVTALRLRMEQTLLALRKVALSHNLVPPSNLDADMIETEHASGLDTTTVNLNGYHHKGTGPNDDCEEQDDIEAMGNLEGQSGKKLMERVDKNRELVFDSEEEEWNDDMSNDDNSFGARGDWGSDSDQSVSSNGSLELDFNES